MPTAEAMRRSELNGHKMELAKENECGITLYKCSKHGCEASIMVDYSGEKTYVFGSAMDCSCFNFFTLQRMISNYERVQFFKNRKKVCQLELGGEDMDIEACQVFIKKQYKRKGLKLNREQKKIIKNYLQIQGADPLTKEENFDRLCI